MEISKKILFSFLNFKKLEYFVFYHFSAGFIFIILDSIKKEKMRIPENKIEEIRSAANIVDLISEFINLRKRGKNFIGLCPFHNEKTPPLLLVKRNKYLTVSDAIVAEMFSNS